jgi:glycosyltransferase involved in cell wall biosynthesis
VNALHVHSGNLFGGVERMMQALAPASAGSSAVRSSFALCFDGQLHETLRTAGADVHMLGPVRARRPDEIRRARRSLRELIDDRRADVAIVHSAWSQAIFGPTILKSGTPLVRWLHSPDPGPLWMEKWASRAQPSLVLANSNYTLENVRGRFGDSHLSVLYPPCLPPTPRVEARSLVRGSLGTPLDEVVIVLAARLEAGKGHAVLVDALAQLRSSRWEAWIVGGVQQPSEQSYCDRLLSATRTAGLTDRVRFLGQRSDVCDLLAAADIFCQPNTSPDSFGLSFVEALAAGLPVVTTRLGAAPEIVDDGCGVLVDASPSKVATALERLIARSDERGAMAAAARLRARPFCDVGRSAMQLAGHLAPLLSRRLAHA